MISANFEQGRHFGNSELIYIVMWTDTITSIAVRTEKPSEDELQPAVILLGGRDGDSHIPVYIGMLISIKSYAMVTLRPGVTMKNSLYLIASTLTISTNRMRELWNSSY